MTRHYQAIFTLVFALLATSCSRTVGVSVFVPMPSVVGAAGVDSNVDKLNE